MSTQNRSLTIYLETEILEALTDYCLSHGITRRDKTTPILATGAVDLMKQALGLSSTLTSTVQVKDSEIEKRFSELENAIAILQDRIGDLQSSKDSEEVSADQPPASVDDYNPKEGLTAQKLAMLIRSLHNVKCTDTYISNYKRKKKLSARVKQILDDDWVIVGDFWYPKQPTP
jgi:hypothetical protein